MKIKKLFKTVLTGTMIVLFAGLVYFLLNSYLLTYKIHTQGLVIPGKEWTLSRSGDGNFISSFKDNIKGVTTSFNVTEFSRGDVVGFELNPDFEEANHIVQGDTIGYIHSNEEQRRLIELVDALEVLNSELLFFTTGQKPEDIQVTDEKLKLAKQDLETEKILFERNRKLFEDSVITHQEMDLFLNQLKLKEYEVQIRAAEYSSAITGEKPEQEELIKSKIIRTQNQIEKIRERLGHFTVVSPFGGVIMKNSNNLPDMMKINVFDTTSVMVLLPVEIFDKRFTHRGDKVRILTKSDRKILEGNVIKIDNVVQKINNRQVFFVTAEVKDQNLEYIGELTEVEIITGEVSAWEYLTRSFNKTISK
ncbi:hypothetical protein ACFSKL_06355 [Belliella marina]|uniref:HlyD family efflux transporter periplasmic adaptor subunit n=1 Tax=Belliella marina TaxID=1644146 RepID=A0ABW4VI87_9BACT